MTDLVKGAPGPYLNLGPTCSLFQDPFSTPGTCHDRRDCMSGCPSLLEDLNLPQRFVTRFPFFCPPPAPLQPAPPPIIWTSRTGKLESKALKHDIFFRVTSQQPFPLHPRASLPFLEGSATLSPGLFPKKKWVGPTRAQPSFLGKSPGDEVGRFREQFLPLVLRRFCFPCF